MNTKKYTQFGTFSVAVMLPLFLLFTVMVINSWLSESPGLYINISLFAVFLLCLLIFYQLSIYVNKTHVSFKFGVGLFGKKYRISDIKACIPVRNSMIAGIGIRMLPNGWLYNVSGLSAIELHFKNKRSVVRIGTNRPEEISELIQSLVSGKDVIKGNIIKPERKWANPLWIVIVLLALGMVLVPNYRDTKMSIEDNGFKIKGVYGFTIPYTDIEQLDTVPDLPHTTLRTSGYASGRTLIGNFKLADKSHVKLFVKKGNPPYIMIRSKDRVPVYINFKDKQKTKDLYSGLLNHLH